MDLRATAAKSLESAFSIFTQDLEALPEDAFTKQFGPKTRSVADIVFEVNMVNDHIGMAIRGEEAPEWADDGWVKAPSDFNTKAIVIEAFKQSSQKIISSVEAMTSEQLEESVQTERGETTRYQRCQFIALHVWYHSGQLNYIQTMIGDDGWHWN